MKIDENGVIRDMTDEEEAECREREEEAEFEHMQAELPEPEPTPEERIARLETENAYLKEALEMILSGATEVTENG